jgi:hypothetical protein
MYRLFLDCSKEPEVGVMWVLLGVVVGIVLMWLYQSRQVREEAQRRLSTAPESWRQAATSAKTVSADQLGRVAHAVDAAPVSQHLRDAFGRATMAARSTAEKLGSTSVADHAATLSVQQLPDGSWIGDAAWGGRTLSDGAPDSEVLIRRLATRLAAIPEVGQPERIKLTRVPQDGPREEHDQELASLLG